MIKGIIFDFDGTLVDTMPLHYEAYRQVLEIYNIKLTKEQFFNNVGGIAQETIPKFLAGRHCPLSISEIHNEKKKVFINIIENREIKTLETSKLLDVFYGSFRIGLASSGSSIHINNIIDRLNWRHYFDVILTGENVKKGKPSPDIFLQVANLLKVDPENCIVFEDTDDGILGAKAANMACFDVRLTNF